MKTVRHLTVGVLLVMAGVAVGVRYGARFRELIRRSSEEVVCSLLPSAKCENSRFNREVNACLKRSSHGGTFKYVELVMQLMQPTTSDCVKKRQKHIRCGIDCVNCITSYVDLYAALSRADGNLLSAYDSGDGTHLNADGYKVFKRMISQ